ncbi:MAG: ArnT family glycosyltransferase [Candidatus Levyibacteriota bacterium]
MKLLQKYAIACIFLVALLLRFYALSTNPPALTWDEAAWGFNAYTLAHTGRDEFGKFLPLSYLESFGDFKPPVYAYLSVLPVLMFGLTEFTTRFASAFFGSLTVLISYFLVLELFHSAKQKKVLALGTSLLLAISPWHILLSRAAFEANVATFFIVLGTFLFLWATRADKNLKYLFLPFLSFAVATNTFNTSRIFLPMFVIVLLLAKRKVLFRHRKMSILSMIPAIIVSIPLGLFLLTPQAKLRFQEVNIFSDIQVIERVNQEIKNDNNAAFSKVIHNRRLAYGVEYLRHYFDNLDPAFLFIHGDGNPKFSIQDVGQMYLWEAPFLVFGTLLLFRRREGNWMLLPFWLILGIIPAATARETPHALRIETVLPVPQILVVYGVVLFAESILKIKNKILNLQIKYAIFGLISITALFNFAYFVHTYFVHYPVTYASEWQYGYKQAVSYAESVKGKYQHIYMTQDLGRPYIYVLYYGQYPPDALKQANVTREALGFVHVNTLEKYAFLNELPFDKPNTLYINTSGKVPKEAKVLKQFLLPNGNPVLTAYEK